MNKVGLALNQARAAEAALADGWKRVGERQAVDHELVYTARHFQTQCVMHIDDLVGFGTSYGADIDEKDNEEFFSGLLGKARQLMSEIVGRRPESGLLLLRDQRMLYTLAHATSFHWMVLGQVAQVMRDRELLDVVDRDHKETLTQIKWLKSEVKVAAPQILCA